MLKNIKIISKYLLIILSAVIISSLTQFIVLFGRPQISQPSLEQICNTTAFYKPSLPPQHDSGFPVPYVTHYVTDDGCGLEKIVDSNRFILNCVFWTLILISLTQVAAKHKKR